MPDAWDLVVVGGGIAGASLAFHAARDGRRVALVEAEAEVGGALATAREPDGFWYELGAHTLYNSYGATLEVLEAAGLAGELQERGRPVLRFLDAGDGTAVGPGKNLGALLRRFSKLELLAAVPRWIGASPEGRTVREHFGRLVGPRNYARVLGPMVSAVPSQRADELPAEMLFKRRERRKDVVRSFTLRRGTRTLVEGLVAAGRVEARTGVRAVGLAPADGGFGVELAGGASLEARSVAFAVAPSACAALLERGGLDAAARAARAVGEAGLDSLGVSVPADAVDLAYATFLIPRGSEGRLRSVVTRDVVPDDRRRAFTFHFEAGTDAGERLELAARVLGVAPADLERRRERSGVLPSPRLGHADLVAALDRALAGRRVAVTGNWFEGLSIEDCVRRSRAEWRRLRSPS